MEPTDDPSEVTRTLMVGDYRPRVHYLVVASGRGFAGNWYKLDGEKVIGRANADIPLDVEGVSRVHARVTVQPDGRLEITDLGSSNGTFVNGERVDSRMVSDGERIQIGTAVLVKVTSDDEADHLHVNQYTAVTRDQASGLYSREYFLESLTKEFAYHQRNDIPLSMVVLTVGSGPDSHGGELDALHRLWPHIGALVLQTVRIEDVAARYEADRLGILLRETTLPEATFCAERIISGVREMNPGMPVLVSAGITTYSGQNYAVDNELLTWAEKYAEEALKTGPGEMRSGRGRDF